MKYPEAEQALSKELVKNSIAAENPLDTPYQSVILLTNIVSHNTPQDRVLSVSFFGQLRRDRFPDGRWFLRA